MKGRNVLLHLRQSSNLSILGGEQLQITLQLPLAATGVMQGMLLFFLLGTDVLITHRIAYRPRLLAHA